MTRNGVPNDIMSNLNPLSLIIMIPIINEVLYPFLRRKRIMPSPIKRIAMGFGFSTSAMVYSAVVQYYIYKYVFWSIPL